MGGRVPVRRTGEAHIEDLGVQGTGWDWPGEPCKELHGVKTGLSLELATLSSSTPRSFKISLRSKPSIGADGMSRSASSVVVEDEAAGEFARVLATDASTMLPRDPLHGLLGQMMLWAQALVSSRTTIATS